MGGGVTIELPVVVVFFGRAMFLVSGCVSLLRTGLCFSHCTCNLGGSWAVRRAPGKWLPTYLVFDTPREELSSG